MTLLYSSPVIREWDIWKLVTDVVVSLVLVARPR